MSLKRLIKNNTKDCLYLYILRILKDGPKHAYVLRKEVEKRFNFKPGNVTAYRVLYAMNGNKLVNVEKRGRIALYKLTKKGENELENSIKFYKERIQLLK